MEMDAEGEEGGHVEIGGQEEPEEGDMGEEEGEVEPQEEFLLFLEQHGRARTLETAWREAEEDLKFRDDLDTLRSRQKNEVDSLENITLKYIMKHIDYFRTQAEEIHSLPEPVFRLLEDCLFNTAEETDLLDILPLVISEKTKKLKLWVSPSKTTPGVWTPETVAKVFGLIEEKCKHTLTCLVLAKCFPLLPKEINTIFASLENLTTLIIYNENFAVNDESLLVLGKNCLKLRCLVLSDIKEITDVGVEHLCARAAPYGQCKNLEFLDLRGTSVTEDGLVTALSNLPNLKNLKHFDLLAALDKICKINGVTKQLQIQVISCHNNSLILTSSELENVCKIIPLATTLLMENVESLHAFFNINDISIFRFQNTNISLPELNSFITHYSHSLTKFSVLHCVSKIDISVLGSCPNLNCLELRFCPISLTNQFQLLPNSFMKLQELFIVPTSANVKLDVSILMHMISSPNLCELRWNDITFPEASLYSLIVEAKENQTVFSSLESFELSENKYSLDTLMKLICVCPKLSELECTFSDESELQLMRFVERNNLPHIRITASS